MSHECRRCNEAIIKVLYLGFVGFAAVQRQGFSKSSLSKMFNCLTGEFLVLEQMNMQFSEWFDVFKQRKSYWYSFIATSTLMRHQKATVLQNTFYLRGLLSISLTLLCFAYP